MMSKVAISTKSAPAAVGPYSQAIKTYGFVFVSGQIGLEPASGKMVEGDVAEQTEQALDNLEAVLKEAESDLDQVVKTTVFLTDMNDFQTVNEAYAKRFTDVPPARAAVGVAALPLGALVEIEAIAMVKAQWD
jgi:2-iminobutanoate/2-iminopropanoate deaminase